MRHKLFLILFICFFAIISHSYAQEEVSIPSYRGYVNDFAGILSSPGKTSIEALARELDLATTAQIALVTIPSTKPLTIEQYAVRLFEKWGIGTKKEDNGVLILMAVNDKKIRIEVGYGLEGAIPDAIAHKIINQVMLPEFKKGNLSQGLVIGSAAVAQLIGNEYDVDLSKIKKYKSAINIGPVHPLAALLRFLMSLSFFLLFFGLRSGFLFYFILGRGGRRRRGMWYGGGVGGSGGGFGGGFGGFGGGLSGGGGASGGW